MKWHQAQLNDLQQRLNRRINEGDKKRIALWPLISIAATVLVVISVGGFWVLVYRPLGQKNTLPVTDKVADVIVTPPSPKEMAPAVKAIPPPALPQAVLRSAKPNEIAMRIALAPVQADGNSETGINDAAGRRNVKQVVEDTLANAKRYVMASISGAKKMPADRNHSLNEVAIVGYATQRKKDITGSVTTINTQLEGRVAGVEVKTPDVYTTNYR